MKRISLFALLLALLAWPLVMQVWARPATAVPYLTLTPSPTSSCPTITPTPYMTPTPFPTSTATSTPPTTHYLTSTPLPTTTTTATPSATPCNFPPTITPFATSTATPCPTDSPHPGPPNCEPTPPATPPTPTPWMTATPVFSATVYVTTSETNVAVGEVVTVTTDLTIASGCVYPVFELTLTQEGEDAPIFAPESVMIGPPVPMPQVITVTAVTTGTITFDVLLYGERNCGGGWQWTYLSGDSDQVTVQNSSSGELPDLIINDITYNGGTPQCGTHPPDLGARVWVQNVGNAPAGSFIVEVNGSQQQTIDGLASGEQTSLVFGGVLGPVTAVADATNQVEESDESNNSFSTILPIPTQPPPCPTPSHYNYLPVTIK